MKLEYQLSYENILEYQSIMAFQDEKIQRKCLTLMISLAILVISSSLLILGLHLSALVPIGIGLVIIFVLFPKLYWRMVMKRIEKVLMKKFIQYDSVQLQIDKELRVFSLENEQIINFNQIIDIQYTKNNYILIYNCNDKRNALIIPINALDNGYQDFDLKIRKEIQNA